LLLSSWLSIDRFVFLLFQRTRLDFQRVRLDWPVLAPGFLKECGMRELRCYLVNMFLSDEILNFSFLQVFSSPMEQILERLRAFGEFEVRKIPPFLPTARCISLSCSINLQKAEASVRLKFAFG
jgi:hypothetical protein